ncbi:MAG: hypothetical protein AAB787_00965 [Patescibacteria group bacterium]
MGNPETVQMMTAGQHKDLMAAVIEQFPTDITFTRAQQLIGRKRTIGEEIARILRGSEMPAEVIAEWTAFYKKLNIEVDLTGLVLPDYEKGHDRLIVIPKGLTLNQVWAACQKVFGGKIWSAYGDDLDSSVPTNDRVPTTSYAIRVRERVEADEELKNLSANDLKKKKIDGVTLLERLVYGLKYFDETGNHLDRENWTLCTGSRDSDGSVPYVYLSSGGEVRVYWCHPGGSDDGLRARSVVS